ncbi:Aste57867_4657 [Aphanomyces stellatus]|uniref:Aste57867_4657 protein n=1 Tax=Aphanomyces stellatus TaxID=120398 RepID=A0A485KG76_9STRA|nr:hypothetical protein As57867_004644 [Aphanomyces stellatus]VFT81760.1 Aste57867_4657 [Aphanomyces stellatus]
MLHCFCNRPPMHTVQQHCQALGEILAGRVHAHFSSFRRATFLFDASAIESLETTLVVEMRELAKRMFVLHTSVDTLAAEKAALMARLTQVQDENAALAAKIKHVMMDAYNQSQQLQRRMHVLTQLWEKEKGILKSQWEAEVAERNQMALDRALDEAAAREERYLRRMDDEKRLEMEAMRRHFNLQKDTEIELLGNQLQRRAHHEMEAKLSAMTEEVQADQRRKQARTQLLEKQLLIPPSTSAS